MHLILHRIAWPGLTWKSIINWNLFSMCWMTYRCIASIQLLIWLLAFRYVWSWLLFLFFCFRYVSCARYVKPISYPPGSPNMLLLPDSIGLADFNQKNSAAIDIFIALSSMLWTEKPIYIICCFFNESSLVYFVHTWW